ncbi:MAG: hypothetical protein OHK0028_12750 [Deltaproteobacteria bacterium]
MNVFKIGSDPEGSTIGIMKFGTQQAHVLPFRRAAMDDLPMPGPWILIQFSDGRYDSRTQGIEMDVLDCIEKIPGFVDDGRFVAVLEQVSYPVVPFIEVFGITGEQASHEGR